FLNKDIVKILNVTKEYIDEEIAAQMKEIERRLVAFRGSKHYDDLGGRNVVLVDDGIATGATMFAAIEWVRKQKPKKLVVAVPVGPAETVERLRKVADEVIALLSPTLFDAVGEFYENFDQVSDQEVEDIIQKHMHQI
ncbi:MAG: phosphoribosyltransferase, partial [Nitrososphaerales archaeon]